MQDNNRWKGLEVLHMVELIPDLQGTTFVRHQTI
jgi:hypothetical protein